MKGTLNGRKSRRRPPPPASSDGIRSNHPPDPSAPVPRPASSGSMAAHRSRHPLPIIRRIHRHHFPPCIIWINGRRPPPDDGNRSESSGRSAADGDRSAADGDRSAADSRPQPLQIIRRISGSTSRHRHQFHALHRLDQWPRIHHADRSNR